MRRFVVPDSVAVFGVVSDRKLWASLVLRFDTDRKIVAITTARPGRFTAGSQPRIAQQVLDQVSAEHGTVSIGLFVERSAAERLVHDAALDAD